MKKSVATWNDNFDLLDGSYSVYDIQKNNPSIRIYANKIANRIIFKIKIGHYIKLLTPETMELLESNENKITKHKNGENVPHLEIAEVILLNCNIINNDYQ